MLPCRTISLATGIALATLALDASALTLNASATWSLDGGASSTDIDSAPPGTYADVLNSANSSTSSVFYHVGGNDGGYYASRVSGDGQFDITGHWHSSTEFTNTLGTAASFNYGLLIENGELSINLPGTAGLNGLASYVMTLSLNGSEIGRSERSLTLGASNTVVLSPVTGFDLGGTYDPSLASYSWGSYTTNFALGTFAAGASFTIDVDVVTRASLDAVNNTCGGGGGGGGQVDIAAVGGDGTGGGPGLCGATARFGDPPNVTGNPGGSGGSVTGNAIPEPGSLALVGLGLVTVLASRRRRPA